MPRNKVTFTYHGVTYKTSDKTALRMLERGNAAGAAKRLAGQSSGAKYIRREARRGTGKVPKDIGGYINRELQKTGGGSFKQAAQAKKTRADEAIAQNFALVNIPQALLNSVPGELSAQLEQLANDYAERYRIGDSMRFNQAAKDLINNYYKEHGDPNNQGQQMERERAISILEQVEDAYKLKKRRG